MAQMFPNAAAYEKMMGRWSARLAPLFITFAQVQNGDRLLDLGCGTGSLVKAAADLGDGAQIVGIDPSQPSIDYCRNRFSDLRITFDCGSALKLPYVDASFAHTLSLLVFQFLTEPAVAANEMRRVTRPGGTVAACTWDSGGGGMEMSKIFWEEAIRLDPPAESKAERPRHCNRAGQLADLWQATGLEDVEETSLKMQTNFSSFDDYWLPQSSGVGPQGVYIDTLSAGRRDALRESLRARLFADRPDGPFSLSARALAVRGTVPR